MTTQSLPNKTFVAHSDILDIRCDAIVDTVRYSLLGGGSIDCENSRGIVCQFYDFDSRKRLLRAYQMRLLWFNQT